MTSSFSRLLSVALFALLTLSGTVSASEAPRAAAPAISLKSLDGKPVTLAQHKGKVVLISFWATWCGPCQQELPKIQAIATKYADKGLVVLTVSVDDASTVAQVRATARKHRLPVLLDPDNTAIASFNPRGDVPFTVIIDRNGNIAEKHGGYTAGDEAKYEKIVIGLLAEAAK
jgi:thiol-disulfide isomerase/thioredoxin